MLAVFKQKKPSIRHIPKPSLKRNEVLIKVLFLGICRTDIKTFDSKKIKNPIILGHEISGIVVKSKSATIKPGEICSVNPNWSGDFCGLDIDGFLCKYIAVNEKHVYSAKITQSKTKKTINSETLKAIAMTEPVAAAMGVFNAKITPQLRGCICGTNRIAKLTYEILKSHDYNIDISETIQTRDGWYDYIIETNLVNIKVDDLLPKIKTGGKLIIKSRNINNITINPSTLVKKELSIQGVGYYDFDYATKWLCKHIDVIKPLMGNTFKFKDSVKAFKYAKNHEDLKTFIQVGKI